jgi:hypothetical protein
MKGTYTNGKIESFGTRLVQWQDDKAKLNYSGRDWYSGKMIRHLIYRQEWINWENSNGVFRIFRYRAA